DPPTSSAFDALKTHPQPKDLWLPPLHRGSLQTSLNAHATLHVAKLLDQRARQLARVFDLAPNQRVGGFRCALELRQQALQVAVECIDVAAHEEAARLNLFDGEALAHQTPDELDLAHHGGRI